MRIGFLIGSVAAAVVIASAASCSGRKSHTAPSVPVPPPRPGMTRVFLFKGEGRPPYLDSTRRKSKTLKVECVDTGRRRSEARMFMAQGCFRFMDYETVVVRFSNGKVLEGPDISVIFSGDSDFVAAVQGP